jgi:hypothetical protein
MYHKTNGQDNHQILNTKYMCGMIKQENREHSYKKNTPHTEPTVMVTQICIINEIEIYQRLPAEALIHIFLTI